MLCKVYNSLGLYHVNTIPHTKMNLSDIHSCLPTYSALAFANAIGPKYSTSDFNSNFASVGSGFFAEVYKVFHEPSNTVMAFKVPKSTETINKFIKEVVLLKSLSNKSILRYYGTCILDGEFGCLTEFLDQGNLACLISSQGCNMRWDMTVKLADGIISGLGYLHDHFILHRDLSSENILLSKSGLSESEDIRAVIADLGLCLNIKDDKGDHVTPVGNPFYTAPEILSYREPYSCFSDVFSLGLILCELITGLKNDPAYLPRTKNYGVDYAQLPVRRDCPKWLQSLACNCCKVHIQQRPSAREAGRLVDINKRYIGLWSTGRQAQQTNAIQLSNGMRTMSVSSTPGESVAANKRHRPPHFFSRHKQQQQKLHRQRPGLAHRHNSLDSFLEPSHLNLAKAREDPGYTETPLSSSQSAAFLSRARDRAGGPPTAHSDSGLPDVLDRFLPS